mgnify:CR=1 FL=1|jgi:hypothetical protein
MTTARTGANTFIGVDVGAVFDTPVAAGTGDQLQVESLEHNTNATELTLNPIGGGLFQQNQSDTGAENPQLTVTAPMGYNDAFNFLIGQAQGQEIVTASASAHIHSFFFNEFRNTNWLTTAFHLNSNTAAEYQNGVVTGLNMTFTPNDYARATANILATKRVTSGGANSAASLATTTQANSQRIIVRPSDRFMINLQGGAALAAGDKVDVTQIDLSWSFENELVGEIRNSAGFGQPRASGVPPLSVELTVTFKELAATTWFSAYEAGTEYKAELLVTGPTLGSTNYRFRLMLPRLKVVQSPDYNLSSPAINPQVVTFRSLVPSAAPTGMPSRYPFFEITNDRATRYLAV